MSAVILPYNTVLASLTRIYSVVCGEPTHMVDAPIPAAPADDDWRAGLNADIAALWPDLTRRERLIAAIAAGREALRRRLS